MILPAFFFVLALWVILIGGWVANIFWTFHQTDWVNLSLGIVGIFVPIIGAIHGIWTWF